MSTLQNSKVIQPLSAQDVEQLEKLRAHRRKHRQISIANKPDVLLHTPIDGLLPITFGQTIADKVTSTIGSWRFIIFQSTAIFVWILGNSIVAQGAWDPYPFILLNLLLSFQAAYTAPAIMMSQNRQSELDRRHAQNDYEINVKAELEIELLHEKIDILKEQELLQLSETVKQLSSQIEQLTRQLSRQA